MPDRRIRPTPGPLVSSPLLEIHKRSLTNGLEVWLVSRPDLGIVSSSVVLQCGTVADSPGLPGVASMTADVLDTGTSLRDALSISAELDRLGSSLKARSGYDGTSIGVNSLARNAGATFGILGEVLGDAVFPTAEVERLRNQRLTAILQQKERPAAVASLALYRLLHGKTHPYGNDPGGTEDSVKSMTRDNVLRFFGTHYHPIPSTMIIVGGILESDLDSLVDGLAKKWQGEAPGVPPGVFSGGDRPANLLIDRPDAPQSEIRIGCAGMRRNSPDFFPSMVMNRILGGQFSSRLNANLREKRGFTYGAWSSFSYGKLPGPFVAGAAVHTQHTGEAVAEVLREIELMRIHGITGDELAFARESIEGGFALAFESPGQVISLLQNLVLYDLPDDYYAKYLENVRSVTREDVLRVAERYLAPGGISTVVVGDARTAEVQLQRAGLREIRVTQVDALGL